MMFLLSPRGYTGERRPRARRSLAKATQLGEWRSEDQDQRCLLHTPSLVPSFHIRWGNMERFQEGPRIFHALWPSAYRAVDFSWENNHDGRPRGLPKDVHTVWMAAETRHSVHKTEYSAML